MASEINPSVIQDGLKVPKSAVRDQLQIASNEITALQRVTSNARQSAFSDSVFNDGNSLTNTEVLAALGYVPASAGAVVMGDGTVSAPGMFFGADVDTGFYRPSNDTLNIAAGGVNVASFNSGSVTVGAFYTDLATGYMGFGMTNPGYLLDFNEAYTDFTSPKHFFHLYGYAVSDVETTLSIMTGYYAHLDGGVLSGPVIASGRTLGGMYPVRGNGTWGAPGTLSDMRGVYGGSLVINSGGQLSGNGTVTAGYGGYFEAGNETTGTGGMTTGTGVIGVVRNTRGKAITSATGLYSYIINSANGLGITTAYGIQLNIDNSGTGISTYYGIYIGSNIVAAATFWSIYSTSTAKSWHRGSFAIGDTSSSALARVYMHESIDNTTVLIRNSNAVLSNAVLRVLADRAASSAYDLLHCTANAVLQFRVRGDGLGYFLGGLSSGSNITLAGYIEGTEQSEPSAPSANGYRIFAKDNGAGKTQLMVRFPSGASQQISIEP
jgi:hypothetical protein